MNIIKELGGLVSDQLIRQVSNSLGESESGIGKVIGTMAPTILAGLLNKSSNSGSFGQIFDMLADKKNVSYLDNLGSLVGGGNLAQNDPKDAAGNLMGSLFGDKVGSIIDMVSSVAGVKKSSSSSLLGMVGPMIMGYLGKKIMKGGLNASGLASLLGSQRGNIADALPGDMADLIGFSAGAPKSSGTIPTSAPSGSGSSGLLKYLLPVLLLVGAFFAWKSCGDDVKNAGDSMVTTATDAAGSISDATKDAAGAIGDATKDMADAAGDALGNLGDFFTKELPGGISLNIPEFGIESSLLKFIDNSPVDKDTWFNFDRINFQTGSAQLDMEASKEQLSNMVSILKAYPDVELKIGGYTDSTGSADGNMKLSQARADNIMKAMIDMGISGDRLAAEGYGSAHPIASDDTEEGRAQNRRIAIRVTKK